MSSRAPSSCQVLQEAVRNFYLKSCNRHKQVQGLQLCILAVDLLRIAPNEPHESRSQEWNVTAKAVRTFVFMEVFVPALAGGASGLQSLPSCALAWLGHASGLPGHADMWGHVGTCADMRAHVACCQNAALERSQTEVLQFAASYKAVDSATPCNSPSGAVSPSSTGIMPCGHAGMYRSRFCSLRSCAWNLFGQRPRIMPCAPF